MEYRFRFLPGECFFGGITLEGKKNPFDENSDAEYDFRRSCPNQTMPLFVSTAGRYLYGKDPFKIVFSHGEITVEGEEVEMVEAGTCLRDAYRAAMQAHFPFDGHRLPEKFFVTPQYNTWMQYSLCFYFGCVGL